MAGHSKWANIQHRKKAQDAKRGKLFTKLIREVSVSARAGGPDPAGNSRLRLAVDKALSGNVPKDTIERAIKRAAGDSDGASIEEIRYEGYGPGGVAVMVDCMTDNRNRTVSEVRHAFTKSGGNLGQSGSVAYLFTSAGLISFPAGADEERIVEAALEAGADDVVTNDDGSIDVLTEPERFPEIKQAILDTGLEPEDAEVTMRPSTSVSLGAEEAGAMVRLLETLEDLDDVQRSTRTPTSPKRFSPSSHERNPGQSHHHRALHCAAIPRGQGVVTPLRRPFGFSVSIPARASRATASSSSAPAAARTWPAAASKPRPASSGNGWKRFTTASRPSSPSTRPRSWPSKRSSCTATRIRR